VSKIPPRNGNKLKKIKKRALLIDGNALLKFGYHGAKNEYNHYGEHIGGLYSFLNITRKLLDIETYDRVFAFWDGPMSGKLRYDIYKDYKSNRDKNYETGTFSQDKSLVRQKKLIWNYLQQLSIRQLEDFVIESDDFISYFCKYKSDEYDITICTLDRDLSQLISESVKIYFCDLHEYITLENYQNFFKHHQSNALLVKIICGDNSDCIKGVKGVKEDTLLKLFPFLTERESSVQEVLYEANLLQEDRIKNKKKPYQALTNIINGITDGIQGDNLYRINNRIMNLKRPLMTNSGIEKIEDIIELPMNPEGRSLQNVYTKMKQNGLDRLITENRFANYMLPFKRIINKESEVYNSWMKENN